MNRQAHRGIAAMLTSIALAALVAGCGGDSEQAAHAARAVHLTAPDTLVRAGELTFCSDVGYPPMEFELDGKPAGADIDIAARLAKLMSVELKIVPTPFDDVLKGVRTRKCDAAISAITNTEERRTLVSFVDYLQMGQSVMVPTSNPHDVHGLEDLGGRRVAVQTGTVNEEFLRKHAANAKPEPIIRAFERDTDATEALAAGTVDAYFGDSPVVAYHIGQEALTYAFAGDPVNPEPIGIAVRRDDPVLQREIQQGIDAMYEDGSMRKIQRRWKLEDFSRAK